MKEMIIINNNGKCEGCDMCYHVQYGGYYCKASKDKMIGNKEDAQKKPEWCPAKEMK